MPISEAIKLLDDQPEPRLIVLDEDGATLRGLLCFDRGSERVLRSVGMRTSAGLHHLTQ